MTPRGTALSPYNETIADRRRVYVADCTLRDGEQQAGLVLSRAHKVKIARCLAQMGVHEIEAGTPAISAEDRDAVAEIADVCTDVRVSALAVAREAAVDQVAETGAWGVRISLPAGSRQLTHKIHITEAEYMDLAFRITEYAKGRGLYVIFSPFDTTRADEQFLRTLVEQLATRGAVDRLRIVDTAGAATPHAVQYLTSAVLEASGEIPVEVHMHDDFGLATANTISGVSAGAAYVSTSMNSLGERSGNAATEQVVAALELLYGIDTGVNMSALVETSRVVEHFSGVRLPDNTPVVGRNSFSHESGLVTAGVINDPFTAEPYDPQIVGQIRRIIHGKKSGRAAIAQWLELHEFPADRESATTFLNLVKDRSIQMERALDESELQAIASQISNT